MTGFFLKAAVGAALVSCGAPVLADPAGGATLRLADAKAMADRAQRAATSKGLNVAVVIVNREGRVILSQRMDGSSFLNLSFAEAKASTSAATGAPTSILEKLVDGGKHTLLSVPGVALVGGGVPITRADQIIGGIGVSGGSAEDDEGIAKSALEPGPSTAK
jgi:uncharacterized protein GlcG (DUF336 family)